jgi:hypothetical protein
VSKEKKENHKHEGDENENEKSDISVGVVSLRLSCLFVFFGGECEVSGQTTESCCGSKSCLSLFLFLSRQTHRHNCTESVHKMRVCVKEKRNALEER